MLQATIFHEAISAYLFADCWTYGVVVDYMISSSSEIILLRQIHEPF